MNISQFKLSIIVTLFTFPIYAQDLNIFDEGLLYVMPNSSVYVGENLSISSNGQLIMDSDSDDFSDFYVLGSSLGSAEYRHFTASHVTRDLVSPPVSGGQTFSDFATNNTGKINGGTLEGGSANLLYGPLDNNNTPLYYVEYSSQSAESLVAAKGYRAGTTGSDGQTLSYEGYVITSNTDIEITYGKGRFKHNNLIGNPFTTHLNTEKIIDHIVGNSSIDTKYKAMYLYDSSASDSFPWKTVNMSSISASLEMELLTPGQAFIVISSPSPTTLFTFPEAAREINWTEQDNSIQGRYSSNAPSFLNLKLSKQSMSYITSIYFNNSGSRGLDQGYDAGSIGSHLGTHLAEDSEGLNLSIQTLPIEDLTSTDYSIPIDVTVAAGEEATLSFSDLSIPSGISFYLDDTEQNIQTLLTSNSYTFTPTTDLNGIGRFYIRTVANIFSAESIALNSVEVFSLTSSNNLTVRGQLFNDSVLKIYDIRGRLISSHFLESNQTEHKIDVSNVSPGVYVINLNNQNQTKTTKLVINN